MLSVHWVNSACYQSVACSRDYWGLERKNLGDATSPHSLPALLSCLPAPQRKASLSAKQKITPTLSDNYPATMCALCYTGERIDANPDLLGVFFFFRCRERLIKLRGKPQSSLNAHTAARQQPYLHLFACLRVSILSQCRRNWDDSFYVITSEASEMSGGTQDTHWEGDLLLWNLPRLYVV